MDERRTSPRLQPQHTITARVVSASPEGSQAAIVLDVSTGGVGLLTSRPLEPTALILLDLPGAGPAGARVRYAALRPDGPWACGCELLGTLSPHELQALVS